MRENEEIFKIIIKLTLSFLEVFLEPIFLPFLCYLKKFLFPYVLNSFYLIHLFYISYVKLPYRCHHHGLDPPQFLEKLF